MDVFGSFCMKYISLSIRKLFNISRNEVLESASIYCIFLLDMCGLSQQRIHVDSVGSNDPYLSGTEPHVRLTNRRVTIELLQLDQPLMLENPSHNEG